MSRTFANRIALVLLGAMVLTVAGCVQARWVERTGDEGTVALAYNDESHRQEAYKMALAAWPGGYDIVWEKEVPIGTTTSSRGSEDTRSAAVGAVHTENSGSGSTTVGAAAGRSRTDSRSTTTTRVDTEYHIHFKAK
ncbi:MAG: hypothetical protein AB7K09_13630 [Planctomycetota bacterium]